MSLEIFGTTICTRLYKQTKSLKDGLTNRLVDLFDNDTFNQAEVLERVGQHMKTVRDPFRVHLERNPRYECPPMIRAREWKALVEYGKERALRKEGKLLPGIGRYAICTFINVIINLIIIRF